MATYVSGEKNFRCENAISKRYLQLLKCKVKCHDIFNFSRVRRGETSRLAEVGKSITLQLFRWSSMNFKGARTLEIRNFFFFNHDPKIRKSSYKL